MHNFKEVLPRAYVVVACIASHYSIATAQRKEKHGWELSKCSYM